MTLIEKINEDLKEAMKAKDAQKLSVIRMLKGAIQLETINKGSLNDDDVIGIIAKQIKMRNDSINEFKKANREDLIAQNEEEINILNKYLPEQLTYDEVEEILNLAFDKIKPTSARDMGLIMKEINPKIKGRYNMQEVSNMIKERLK